jgi:two-component system response regulator YesN
MYSIVFAEDEKTTRENICRVIDWERYGFVICATASDGEEALQAVQRYRPEVLITDIRMPFMDGLELSKQAKKVLPSIKIIILSGFMEFGYAQDAIRIGVQDYIVKPVTPDKLIRILVKLNEQLQEENDHQAHVSRLIEDLRKVEHRLQESPGGEIGAADISHTLQAEEQLDAFLREGTPDGVEAFTDRLLLDGGETSFRSSLFFLLKMLGSCVKAVESMNGDPHATLPQIDDITAFLERTTDLAHARTALCACFGAVVAYCGVATSVTAGLVDKAKNYVRSHYDSPALCTRQMADIVGLSPNYFSNVFKQYAGTPFTKYLTGYRIDRAGELLRTTDYSVVEIARRVGYDNANYFSAVFHRVTGLAPLAFKEGGIPL